MPPSVYSSETLTFLVGSAQADYFDIKLVIGYSNPLILPDCHLHHIGRLKLMLSGFQDISLFD